MCERVRSYTNQIAINFETTTSLK